MILEKIRKSYSQLTPSQKALADFIVSYYREAAFMTASCLAERVDLNEATVIRFAQRLGYPGYPELVEQVQALVQQELAQFAGTAEEPFLVSLNAKLENVLRIASHIPAETTQRAVEVLLYAQHIYIIGQGPAQALAQLFSLSLQSIGIAAHSPPGDLPGLSSILDDLDQQDLVIAISTRSAPTVAHTLAYANKHGAQTLALAWAPTSPCAQAADISISYAMDDSPSPPIALIAALIDTLVQQLAILAGERAKAHRQKRERIQEFLASRAY